MYETKPLKLFEKAKELRLKHYRELMTAKEKGKLIMAGSAHAPKDLVVGIGEFEQICGEPWAASIAADPELSRRCLEAAEAKGYKRDMCAYMRLYWGSMFLNVSPWGGYPKPDFVLQSKICDSHGKWYQVVSEHLGIPCFITECPSDESQTLTKTRTTEYMAAQYADAIEWLKEITGREYNYEAMVQAVINSWRTKVLWSEICELNQAIPAPLSQNMMLALFMPAVLEYHRKEIVDFYRELKDEIKYRVEQGIAAEPNEKIRILHDGTPPWYALDLFKDYRKQGVAIIGGPYLFYNSGLWEVTEKGDLKPMKPIEEMGLPQSTKEALWYRALMDSVSVKYSTDLRTKLMTLRAIIRGWKCNGIIFHINRGCKLLTLDNMQNRLALQKDGIPTMLYEGSMGDERDWDEQGVTKRLKIFLGTLTG